MALGITVKRDFIVVLNDGTTLLEWDNATGVDLLNGVFVGYDPHKFCHPVTDSDLETLKRAGRIVSYDKQVVILNSLPEVPDSN